MSERNAAPPSSSAPAREESPADLMKRCTALALRAVAGRADLDVGFVAGAASVRGSEIKLPAPQRTLTEGDLVRLRGTADAVALRFRYHNDAVHARRMPPDPQARKVYEAVEQARIEALGARRMAGVARNIAGVLDQRSRAEGLDRITRRDDMPLSEAMRFIAREHFLGAPPPPAAEAAVALWRAYVEEKVGAALDRLAGLVGDEDSFAGSLKDLLFDLDLFSDNELETEDRQSDEEGEQAREGQSDGAKDQESEQQGQGQRGEGQPKAAPSAAEGSGEQDGMESAGEEMMVGGVGTEEPGGPSRQRQQAFAPTAAAGERP